VTLPAFKARGVKKIKVTYLGSSNLESSKSSTVRVTVRG
jgi:hypothetical protein